MRTLVAVNPDTVFSKTPKGREEIAQRTHGLNASQRRVLIIIDGNKTFEEITALIPAIILRHELEQIFSLLLQQGFIASKEDDVARPKLIVLEKPAAAPVISLASATPYPPGAQPMLDPETVRQVKDFMTTTAHTYLGLLSAEVIQRIERTRDAAQLLSVVGHWHMALRDSKQGNRFAGPYLEQVRRTLSGGAPPAEQAQSVAHLLRAANGNRKNKKPAG